MSFHKPTRLQKAMHEAGHAYAFAAAVPSEQPVGLTLSVDGAGNVRGSSRRRMLFTFGTSLERARYPRDWEAAAEIFITVAGPLSEFRQRHRNRDAASFLMHANSDRFLEEGAFDTEGDFEHIRAIMDNVGEIDRRATFREAIDAADFTLTLNWRSINKLARTLFDREHMGKAELSTWFGDHPATSCPIELHLVR